MDKKIFLLDKEWYTEKRAKSYSVDELERLVAEESYEDACTIIKIDGNGCNTIDEALEKANLRSGIVNGYHILDFGFRTFSEVRSEYVDDGYYHVYGWKTYDDNEDGKTIAVVNAKTADVFWVDNCARDCPEANAAIDEVVKKIRDDKWLALVAVDGEDDFVILCVAAKTSQIESGAMVDYIKENLYSYLPYMNKEEMEEDVLEDYNQVCDFIGKNCGGVKTFDGYTLYWKEIDVK